MAGFDGQGFIDWVDEIGKVINGFASCGLASFEGCGEDGSAEFRGCAEFEEALGVDEIGWCGEGSGEVVAEDALAFGVEDGDQVGWGDGRLTGG